MALTASVDSTLQRFVGATRAAFETDLVSVVLFGSAAEDRLRQASDVNVALVLTRFEPARAARLAPAAAMARGAIRLLPMFVLESEFEELARLFAAKYMDIARRHRVLFGRDPFEGLDAPRPECVRDLARMLGNLAVRLRAQFVSASSTPDRFASVIAESAGQVRVAAATLLDLEGRPARTPREALASVSSAVPGATELAARVSAARESGALSAEVGSATCAQLLDVVQHMRERAARLA
jgi:predicted nucleotidyltransferase